MVTATAVKYGGYEFTVEPEPADFWGWVAEGRYDSEWRALEAHLKPNHTFLDLGAWVGSHSLLAGKICKRVIAVEPDPVAFKTLSKNLEQNNTNYEAFQWAISDKSGALQLGSGMLGASTTRVNFDAGGGIGEATEFAYVNCMTLQELIEITKLTDPLFIKMDVEGSEEQILSDLTFFEQHKPTLYIELHPFWWHDVEAMWARISDLARLYKRVLNRQGNAVTISDRPSELILIGDSQ